MLGLGLIISDPSGVSLKWFRSEKLAFDGEISWDFSLHHSYFYFHADYLKQKPVGISSKRNLKMLLYYGVGGCFTASGEESGLGVRIPFGICLMPAAFPVDVFAEIAGNIDILPYFSFSLKSGIGGRYFF